MDELSIVKLKCLYPDCAHVWVPRTSRKPKVCPRCKRYGWDIPHPLKLKVTKERKGGAHNVKTKKSRKKPSATDQFRQRMNASIK